MMKYTIPVLALVISAVLSGCATPPSTKVTPPVAEKNAVTVIQPLKRQLAEGLYEMALSPRGDALYVASAEGFKDVQGGAVYKLDPKTLKTIGLSYTDLKNFAVQIRRMAKRCSSPTRLTAASAPLTPPPAKSKSACCLASATRRGCRTARARSCC